MRRYALVLLAGCATAATKDHATSAKKDAADATAAAIADAGPTLASADAAPPAPERVTAFYPVVQGACGAARPVRIGSVPVLHFAKAAWALPADAPAKLIARQPAPFYSRFVGVVVGDDWNIAALGGTDLDHVWYTTGSFSGRGEDQSYLTLGGKTLDTPHGEYGYYGIQHVIQQPDGSIWAYAHHGMYLDMPGDEAYVEGAPPWRYNRWFAWSKDGTPQKINLPMGDMELAERLESGELVAAGLNAQGAAQLRRWSPTRKVNDFTTKDIAGSSGGPELRVGKTRAVLKPKDKPVFYSYDGADTFGPSPVSAKAQGVTSWVVTQSDELWITTKDGRVLVEAKDGTISEEKLPEPATLARETSTPWLMATSGAVYERSGKEWRKLEVPDGLWSEAQHPPNQIEWVAVLGGETWVGAVRTDRGFGTKKPAQIRTFYASKPRAAPLRCGSPFEPSILASLPARPDAACKDFLVVLGRERSRDGKVTIPYPKIAAALKGNAAVGDKLELGVFGGQGAYGIRAPTREVAEELAKKLTRVTAHEPEIVCGGAADFAEKRSAPLDVKAGAFTSIPDAGAP